MSDELTDLLELLDDACTNEQIRVFLRDKKHDDKDIRVSGNTDSLIHQLRTGYERGSFSLEHLQKLLARAEENGRQHIFLYKPKRGATKFFADPEAVASRLWGKSWQTSMKFPQFYLAPTEMQWADFRYETKPGTKLPEWTMKLYSSRESRRLIDTQRERKHGKVYVTQHLVEERTRLVWLVKWRPWGLLEIRVPAVTGESRKACLTERDSIWQLIRQGVSKTEFSPWDLREVVGKIVRGAKATRPLHRVATTLASHSGGGGTAQFNPEYEDGSLFESSAHEAALSVYDTFPKADVFWLPNEHTPFDKDLRVQMGVYDSCSIRIGTKASPEAVDYVINRLRQL